MIDTDIDRIVTSYFCFDPLELFGRNGRTVRPSGFVSECMCLGGREEGERRWDGGGGEYVCE